MCYYHAYQHHCGHTEMIFQQFCSPAQMLQQRCPRSNPGIILTTVKLEYACASCPSSKVGILHIKTQPNQADNEQK
ncbi:uncharacterized protein EI97DRAFT_370336 [Westerdykella ornata]|uniref:Uncharacterized protein n=1 Tax=Westerdykella ornata TaxID=318751 RepID=A0A6A6JTM8_WESOR|nr:uncharacterized protein EI97DRAFT_370336 [Westerdykella ornata]KAF2279463.1 hypothetical protein EI97DRAFT_370336 [Westerdykella ornata]